MYGDHGMGFFGGGFMWIFWLLLIGLAVWLFARGSSGGGERPSALETLKQRYARGEIDEAEYQRMKATLTGENDGNA